MGERERHQISLIQLRERIGMNRRQFADYYCDTKMMHTCDTIPTEVRQREVMFGGSQI